MTKKEFEKQRWGAGMVIKYVDKKKSSYTEMIADIVSVDFESYTIGIEIPGSGDLVFLPCEKCSLYTDITEGSGGRGFGGGGPVK